MLLLSIDTSGKYGSIALSRCNSDGSCDAIEVVPLVGGTFSAELVPQISALLAKHGFSKQDIDGFAVATGPGSFTGLRVGLAAIKALAEALGKPIAAVSLLEAVAGAGSEAGRVLAVMDAGRKEVFAGDCEVDASHSKIRVTSEELIRLDELSSRVHGRRVLTPDEDLGNQLRQNGVTIQMVTRPRSDAIARLGWRKIQAGETVTPEQLEANYIRRADAEIFSKP